MARPRRDGPRRTSLAQHLIIMAKLPVAGRVKRRLAREIGDVAAIRFYRTTLASTVRRLGADPRWRTYLAVTPDEAVAASCWPVSRNLARIPQGKGGLGQRMQSLFDSLPPGPVIIVGSDIPAIRPSHIACAFKHLGRADAVFGPATDGGYWLVGLKRSPRRLVPFAGVLWSTKGALAATIANLRGKIVGFAPTLSDVDTMQDYRRERKFSERFCSPPLTMIRAA
jgi:rSAM/selenodomain-associated transferase 1